MEQKTLWVGGVDASVQESHIHEMFAPMASVSNVRIVRGSGNSPGHAYVELAYEREALAVLEALRGGPIVAKNGQAFPVDWATSPAKRPSERKAWPPATSTWDRWREREHGDGAGRWHWEQVGDKGAGPPPRERQQWPPWEHDAGADGHFAKDYGQRRGGFKGGGKSNGKTVMGGSRTRVEDPGFTQASWAYIDPSGDVQKGFTTDEMWQWYDMGYFDRDLEVGLMKAEGRRVRVPSRHEFYPLRQWFPDPSTTFSYIPKF